MGVKARPVEERFRENLVVSDGCWTLRLRPHTTGYTQISQGRGTNLLGHRISWEIHCGPIPDGMFVCHSCDNPGCVRPDHLFLGSAKDNTQDMMGKGRHRAPSKGPNRPLRRMEATMRKLDEEQVATIRERFAAGGVSMRQLGREYGVTHESIRKIVRGITWV